MPLANKIITAKSIPAKGTKLEADWLLKWKMRGGPTPIREVKFHPFRKWRLDFSWPDLMCACETHGGTFVRGGHSRGMGQHKDYEKWNAAAAMGWTLFHFDTIMVREGKGFDELLGFLKGMKNGK